MTWSWWQHLWILSWLLELLLLLFLTLGIYSRGHIIIIIIYYSTYFIYLYYYVCNHYSYDISYLLSSYVISNFWPSESNINPGTEASSSLCIPNLVTLDSTGCDSSLAMTRFDLRLKVMYSRRYWECDSGWAQVGVLNWRGGWFRYWWVPSWVLCFL